MFRRLVFLAATLYLLAANLSAAQDTISASEILKVWEKTAINDIRCQIELRNHIANIDSEGVTSGSIMDVTSKGEFRRSKSLGMRMQIRNPNRSGFNLLGKKGVSYDKQNETGLAIASIDPAGKTRLEQGMLSTQLLMAWLDPSASPAGKVLSELGDTKIELTGERGVRRAKFLAKGRVVYTLAEEFDWRVLQEAIHHTKGLQPNKTFEYQRGKGKSLQLTRGEAIIYKHPEFVIPETTFTIKLSEYDLSPLVEDDLKLEIPAPARVTDNTVDPKRKYLVLEDGSEIPYSQLEHRALSERLFKERQKPREK